MTWLRALLNIFRKPTQKIPKDLLHEYRLRQFDCKTYTYTTTTDVNRLNHFVKYYDKDLKETLNERMYFNDYL
jgi:hypothetical protein